MEENVSHVSYGGGGHDLHTVQADIYFLEHNEDFKLQFQGVGEVSL